MKGAARGGKGQATKGAARDKRHPFRLFGLFCRFRLFRRFCLFRRFRPFCPFRRDREKIFGPKQKKRLALDCIGRNAPFQLVEIRGVEPLTFSMPLRRSTN